MSTSDRETLVASAAAAAVDAAPESSDYVLTADTARILVVDDEKVIREILALRRELAAILGYRDFADYQLEERMARDGATAFDFVRGLTERTRQHFEREVAEMEAFARAVLTLLHVLSAAPPSANGLDRARLADELAALLHGHGGSATRLSDAALVKLFRLLRLARRLLDLHAIVRRSWGRLLFRWNMEALYALAGRLTTRIANGSLQRSLVWLVLAALLVSACAGCTSVASQHTAAPVRQTPGSTSSSTEATSSTPAEISPSSPPSTPATRPPRSTRSGARSRRRARRSARK